MADLNPRSATRRDRCTAFSAVTGGDGCHWSRFGFRVPHCVSLRDGLNTRSTCRLSARITPMRAIAGRRIGSSRDCCQAGLSPRHREPRRVDAHRSP